MGRTGVDITWMWTDEAMRQGSRVDLTWRGYPASWAVEGATPTSRLGEELWATIQELRDEVHPGWPEGSENVGTIGVGKNVGHEIIDALHYLETREPGILASARIVRGAVGEHCVVTLDGTLGHRPPTRHLRYGRNLTPVQQETFRRLREDGTLSEPAEKLAKILHPST